MAHREFRRVVTGHDANGKAVVVQDSVATQYLERPNRPGVRLTNFWMTDSTPAEYAGPEETCTGDFVLHPPKNGTVFRCVEFMPEDPAVMATLDGKAAFAEMGAGDNIVENDRHPWMHRTDSIDYAFVISGSITMVMEDEEHDTLLHAGDVVVQRGNVHAWANRGTEPCTIMFVLVDGVTSRDAAPENKKGVPVRG